MQALSGYTSSFLRYSAQDISLRAIAKILLLLALLTTLLLWAPLIRTNYYNLMNYTKSDLFVKQVAVVGDSHLGNKELLQLIGLKPYTSLYKFKARQARSILLTMPWIKDVDIEKIYPDKLQILITERKPYLIYRHNDMLEAIDDEGVFMGPSKTFSAPIVEGEITGEGAFTFIKNLSKLHNFFAQVKIAYCHANNRWDLLLQNNMWVKLPSQNPQEVLKQLWQKNIFKKLLQADITTIDLRNPDAIAVILAKPEKQAATHV